MCERDRQQPTTVMPINGSPANRWLHYITALRGTQRLSSKRNLTLPERPAAVSMGTQRENRDREREMAREMRRWRRQWWGGGDLRRRREDTNSGNKLSNINNILLTVRAITRG